MKDYKNIEYRLWEINKFSKEKRFIGSLESPLTIEKIIKLFRKKSLHTISPQAPR